MSEPCKNCGLGLAMYCTGCHHKSSFHVVELQEEIVSLKQRNELLLQMIERLKEEEDSE